VFLALLAAGCTWFRQDRQLPRDRGAAVVYAALGDSTVEGVGASSLETHYVSRLYERLRAIYPDARLTNLGVGGATSADVIAGQLQRAIELSPHLITLSIGPNDVTGRVTVQQYERNLDTIFGRLTRETTAVLVVNLLPDLAVTPRFSSGTQKDAVAGQTVLFNEALGRKGREYGVELVDLYGPSREEVPKRPQLIALDGYHPSDLGYARWAELMWKGVEARIAAR
jgi:lysophospholipase L1-like esterase